MNHTFDVNIAKEYNVDTATFLQNLRFWTLKNLANKKHIHDGLCWSYNTLEALHDIFPYWSKKQLERVIRCCVDKGLIKKGNYNSTPYDRTCWYALTPKCYWLFLELSDAKFIYLLLESISPNGEIEKTEWRNLFPRSETPIPDINPDKKTNNTYTVPSSSASSLVGVGDISLSCQQESSVESAKSLKPEMVWFDEFWKLYPSKKARKSCLAVWKRRKLDDIADLILERLELQVKKDDSWNRGFVPNPLTYLNQDRWEDEVKTDNGVLKAKGGMFLNGELIG